MLDNDNDNPAADNPAADSPAAASRPATGRTRRARAVPPKRIRVSALAKDLGMASRELLALLGRLGEAAPHRLARRWTRSRSTGCAQLMPPPRRRSRQCPSRQRPS